MVILGELCHVALKLFVAGGQLGRELGDPRVERLGVGSDGCLGKRELLGLMGLGEGVDSRGEVRADGGQLAVCSADRKSGSGRGEVVPLEGGRVEGAIPVNGGGHVRNADSKDNFSCRHVKVGAG